LGSFLVLYWQLLHLLSPVLEQKLVRQSFKALGLLEPLWLSRPELVLLHCLLRPLLRQVVA
jgi:hypothetical protein